MSDELITFAVRAVFILATTYAIVRYLTDAVRRFLPRDPVRLFTAEQKRYLMAQAGARCEHRPLLWFRCFRNTRLQADHIMPWSRGGRTTIENGQMLCATHNRRKTNRIPSPLYRARIRLRRSYGAISSTRHAPTLTLTGRARRTGGRTPSTH